MNFHSNNRKLEIPEFLAVKKHLVDDTKKQIKSSSRDHSIEINTIDYELIQAFREAGL